MNELDRQARLARREFVRRHHPDRGGDPDVFQAGLKAFANPNPNPNPGPGVGVTAVRRQGALREVVLGLVRRWRRWHAPPRVR